jgi:hypothetical protein
MGVTRFLWIDDESSDGSIEFLRGEPDVDIYTSNVRYREAYGSRLWRHMLVEQYGRNRWYVSVDLDEYLVYCDFEHTPLHRVIARLEQKAIKRLAAPMLDMYPPGRVADSIYEPDATGRMPWEVASLFDASGYTVRVFRRGLDIRGGARARLGGGEQLAKFPLLYWDRHTSLRTGNHTPLPYWRNWGPILGNLLHFKFFSDFAQRFRETAANAQHFKAAAFYLRLLKNIPDPDRLVLESQISAQFRGSGDLSRRGFFADWRTI